MTITTRIYLDLYSHEKFETFKIIIIDVHILYLTQKTLIFVVFISTSIYSFCATPDQCVERLDMT